MNKLSMFSASVACLAVLSSCYKDPENHLLTIVYPSPYQVLYADQVEDSVIFETFDSYNMESQNDWISITAGASHSVSYDYMNLYSFTSLLAFTQNKTGKTRVGTVRINSYEYSSAAIFYQLGQLNIKHPAPSYFYKSDSNMPDSAAFSLQVDASVVEDSLCFTVSQPWTLDFAENADRNWATIANGSGKAGYNNVAIKLIANTDKENARKTELVLKCGDVTNIININQSAAPKTTEE